MKSPGLMARKVGMTRMYDDQGLLVPVTLLKVEDSKVTKVLTPEKEGYHAIQVGYYIKPEKQLTKCDVARLRKVKVNENFARFQEFRSEKPIEGAEVGVPVDLSALEGVVAIDVTGLTKGRGYQGAVKRWGVARGRMTHGSRFHRRPGSLGCRTSPGRVMKNKKMPGHYGVERTTIQNLKVLDLDKEAMTLAIKGSIPGHCDSFVMVRPSVKVKAPKAPVKK